MIEGIRKVAVIGAGIMGHGIGLEFAEAGYAVAITDSSPAALDAARDNVAATLAERGKNAGAIDQIVFTTSLEDAGRDADLVIEAVSERLPLKEQIFGDLDRLAPPHAILASNSSSFMPSQMAPFTKRPDKVVVTHYFNPPHVAPLVEVVKGPETSDATAELLRRAYDDMGKIPVVVQKERLGFIGNRLQMAMFREALSLVSDGVCSVEDLDTVIHSSIGRRWSVAGIFEVFDLAGLDTVLAVSRALMPDLSNADGPPAWFVEMVEGGDLGIKSGKGFYDWDSAHGEEARARIRRGLSVTGKTNAVT
ncbi:MAG: 3-hydroxyacyl-CoA dehydrogenase family protein [Thermomicrobiales bacterium]|nr:3-hydroxyacyl-CoA dehydrogenase family protein [Thermomicrobiales bacterium]